MKRHRYRYRDETRMNITPEDTTVTLVGVAGIGTRIAEILAREGFSLRLIDRDKVSYHDLYPSTLFREEDVETYKAEAAKKRLKKLHSQCVIKAFAETIREESAYLLQGDCFISCAVDESANQVLYEKSMATNTPWVVVSLDSDVVRFGTTPEGVVDTDYHGGDINPVTASFAASLAVSNIDAWIKNGQVTPYTASLPGPDTHA